MTTTTVPTWSDGATVVAAAVLARGATTRGSLDLRSAHGALLFVRIGRGGTTALTNGVSVQCRRTLNNDAILHVGGIALLSSTVAAVATTVNADSASGQAALGVASIGAIVADDIVCIQDSGGGVTRLEWARVSKVATGVLTLDAPLKSTHSAANADTVRSKADVFAPLWLDGGATWEVVFDYGDDAAGDSVTVEARAQVLTAYTTA